MIHRTLHFLLLGIVFASCSTYQYVHLTSDLPQTADSKHYYLTDSDVYVDFDFNGKSFPVKIYLVNEGESTLYIDMTETVFFENGEFLIDAYGLGGGNIEENVMVLPGKGASFNFTPFRSEFSQLLKAQSSQTKVVGPNRSEHAIGKQLEDFGNEYEIRIGYRKDEVDGRLVTLKASFKEEKVHFSSLEPMHFPTADSPNCYYVMNSNHNNDLAAELIAEVVTVSLIHLIMYSVE